MAIIIYKSIIEKLRVMRISTLTSFPLPQLTAFLVFKTFLLTFTSSTSSILTLLMDRLDMYYPKTYWKFIP